MKKIQLMGHIIGGYPNKESSIQAGLGICEGGASFLEVQFPFSDPNADGPIIENACSIALKNGFKVEIGFDIVKTFANNTNTQILIMTYANIIFSYGIKNFVKKAKECGTKGLIVPDLPFGSDEGLRKIAKDYQLPVIELITPGMTDKRIQKLSKTPSDFVYVVARSGTTGSKTQIQDSLFEWIEFVKKNCNKKIALGFGISSSDQIKALRDKIDIVIAGSYFVQKITDTTQIKNIKQALKAHTLDLLS